MHTPPEFDEAMVEAPKPEKSPEPGSDEYYAVLGREIDKGPIGVPHHRGPLSGPID
ncbi:MAG: hypothetical protein AB202_02070 [Parcubacteria bacterium C7867-007]|nr:MAG: hypothetical protein AB202_02070 [Parcubacteria bacterium C7867-007]